MRVAPKNSQKGMRKWPQQMPQRSKAALGHAASTRMPMKPCLHTPHTLLKMNSVGGGLTTLSDRQSAVRRDYTGQMYLHVPRQRLIMWGCTLRGPHC